MAIDRANAQEVARALAALDAWDKVAPYNWALVSQLNEAPFFVAVNVARDSVVRARLMLFDGFDAFRAFMLAQRIPDFGVALTPMEFDHYEIVATHAGEAQIFTYVPGYVPRMATGEEQARLASALYACYGLMMRVEEDPGLLGRNVGENALFALREGLDGRWHDGAYTVPGETEAFWQEKIVLDRRKCEAASRLPFARDEKWEADFVLVTQFHTNEPRARFLYMLAAVDADGGERMVWQKMSVGEGPDALKKMWEGHAQRFLDAILRLGRIPGEIHVRSQRFARFLRPLGLQLPFKIVQHAKLEHLANVLDAALRNPETL